MTSSIDVIRHVAKLFVDTDGSMATVSALKTHSYPKVVDSQ